MNDAVDDLNEEFRLPGDWLIKYFSRDMNGLPKKKKRGAPFEKQNARKHGLYSKFSPKKF